MRIYRKRSVKGVETKSRKCPHIINVQKKHSKTYVVKSYIVGDPVLVLPRLILQYNILGVPRRVGSPHVSGRKFHITSYFSFMFASQKWPTRPSVYPPFSIFIQCSLLFMVKCQCCVTSFTDHLVLPA
jgi:hypothetical protein